MRFWLKLLLLLSLASSALAEDSNPKPYLVYLVLWRESTDIEEGFREYLNSEINVQFEVLNAEQNTSNLPHFIQKIKEEKPDLVYAWGTSVTLGLVGAYDMTEAEKAKLINDIPVVFTLVSYPTYSRIVPNEHSSGRNVTGSSHLAPLELQINAIKGYNNNTKTLGVIFNPREPNSVENVEQLKALAEREGLTLLQRAVPLDADATNISPIPEMIPALIDELAPKVDFLYLGPDSFLAGHNKILTTLSALWAYLPTFTSTEASIKKAFATIGLVSAYKALGQFTADKAVQILKEGKKPSEIPVETLERFTYILNVPVVHALDYIPPLALAGEAIVEDRPETQQESERLLQFKAQEWKRPLFSITSIPLD